MEQHNNNNMNPDINPTGVPEQPTPEQAPEQVVPPMQAQEPAPAPKSGKKGPVAGIVIIIILLIFGGLYFWGASLNNQAQLDENTIFDSSENEDIAPASDEPVQIESDLDAFDTADFEAQLDADLKAMEAEL